MSGLEVISGAEIFDGHSRHAGSALLVENGMIRDIIPQDKTPSGRQQTELDGGLVVPGFVDLQVNGGGGVLFNDWPDADAIETICRAHAQYGTTALLPTLITDTPRRTELAIKAGIEARSRKTPGFLGLHLEGPHLSIARKGAHDQSLIRPMNDVDLASLITARENLPNLMITAAPESVSCRQIEKLVAHGVVVSIGHSDASFTETRLAAQAGARAVTHLYNAMSPLSHREPGVVGAAMESSEMYAGLIADGHHVEPAAISVALKAKTGIGKVFLVTDAMSTIGTNIETFTLNGRTVTRTDGRLTLDDGTLAGTDLDMISAVHYMADTVGVGFEEAIRMASLYPAQCMSIDARYGHLKSGANANFIHLDAKRNIQQVWINGVTAFALDSMT